MPNTSTPRSEILTLLRTTWLTTLNPLDYSAGPNVNAGWQYLGERMPFFATAATLLVVSWSVGALICGVAFQQLGLTKLERFVIALGSGLSLQSLWILGCGLTGNLTPFAILTPGSGALAVTVLTRLRKRNSAQDVETISLAVAEQPEGRWTWFFGLMICPFVLHIVLGGMTPPWDFDVREYHLQGPKEWFVAGRICTLEHNVYTSFPFLSEMLSLGAMVLQNEWWHGAVAGKLTLAMFQLLSALTVFAIGRRWFGHMPAWIGAAAFLSTPWIVRISTIAYAEGAITFYLIASVMTAMLAAECASATHCKRLIGVTGFLAGSAMAAKYPGVLSVILPVGLFLLTAIIVKNKRPEQTIVPTRIAILKNASIFVMGILLAVGPWLVKNAVATGNPVYPLAYSVFGAQEWSPEMDAKWKNGHSPSEHQLTRIPEHLAAVALKNDWQNGFLFAFAIPALLLVRREPRIKWLAMHAAWLLATWWLFTHRIDRFWIPLIPVTAVLAGAAWTLSPARTWRLLMVVSLSLCAAFNYCLCRYPKVIGFHGGLVELETVRNLTIRPDVRLLNAILKPNARVLMVGEAEVFDVHCEVVYNTVFDENIFQQWTSALPGYTTPAAKQPLKRADEIAAVLQQNGITHILVNWSEVLRYRLTYGYTKYVYPERFVHLQDAGVISKPVTLSAATFSSMPKQKQHELQSLPGSDELIGHDDSWSNVQLFKVTPPKHDVESPDSESR